MPLILVGGGSRSGKSSFALQLARERGVRRAFIATAEALDDEMQDRIAQHQAERQQAFTTIEEPLNLARVLAESQERFDVILVDCLTLWVSNLMMQEEMQNETKKKNGTHLIENSGAELVRIAAASPVLSIFVTNEVGCGVVPDNSLARRFRDVAGRLNQQAARSANEVYLLAFGIATRLK